MQNIDREHTNDITESAVDRKEHELDGNGQEWYISVKEYYYSDLAVPRLHTKPLFLSFSIISACLTCVITYCFLPIIIRTLSNRKRLTLPPCNPVYKRRTATSRFPGIRMTEWSLLLMASWWFLFPAAYNRIPSYARSNAAENNCQLSPIRP